MCSLKSSHGNNVKYKLDEMEMNFISSKNFIQCVKEIETFFIIIFQKKKVFYDKAKLADAFA